MYTTVSVVISTHNRLELLLRAITSVQQQTLKPIEIIVVDDCSDDTTISYLESNNLELVSMISLDTPSGANVARNRGLSKATGDIVAFLDDDDYWDDTKLQKQLALMNERNAPFSYTGLHNITPSGKTIKKRFYPPSDSENIFRSLMINNFMGSTSSIAVDRQFCINNAIQFDEQLESMQDYDFYLHCFRYTNNVAPIDKCLTYYHQERSIWQKKTSSNYFKFSRARAYLLNKYRDDPNISLLKNSLDTVRFKKCLKYPFFFLGVIQKELLKRTQ